MPNWCLNNIEISHKDGKWWDWFMSTKFNFQKILPCPPNIHKVNDDEEPYNHHFSTVMWGTKWPIDQDELDSQWDKEAKGAMSFNFETAWSPPLGIYKALQIFGFKIRATYLEEGCNFCGLWDNTIVGDSLLSRILSNEGEFDNCYKLDEIMPNYITTQEKWEKFIENNPLDQNEKKILEDFNWWVEDRIEWNRENEEEEDEGCE